jgi:5-methylcytosine-specific restriction protein A
MIFDPDIRPGTELTSKELNGVFQGQEQGGMRYSRTTNSLVLVTDHKKLSGTSIYGDEWIDGVLHYRGTGQRGDQNIDFAGNSRLVHAAGADAGVHLVERTARGRYRYLVQCLRNNLT